jgi:hypothetical protein
MALYELRTYTLRVGAMTEALKLYQELGFPPIPDTWISTASGLAYRPFRSRRSGNQQPGSDRPSCGRDDGLR